MEFQHIKADFESLRNDRKNWDEMYQVVGEYVSQIKQNFQECPQPGEFLVGDIFDSTGPFAAHTAASALLGMLWPGSAKMSIEIIPPDDMEDIDTELNEFYERMTARATRAMDDPRANLALAFDEYMLDQIIFGTSGVGVEAGDESLLLYKPYGVKEAYIDEGKNGRVARYFLFYEWTVRRAVDEYGIDNVSEKIREKYLANKFQDRVKILVYVCKRGEKKARAGKFAMKYAAYHYDYDGGFLLREDGFHEMPAAFGRFKKLNYERYGRSPAMNALPDIREANVLREACIMATEKALDMPKGVFSDGVLGGGVIDQSPHAINVFNATGANSSGNPIFDIGSPPDIRAALSRLEELRQSISQHFFIDRLLDFNNSTQMTFGEAQIRENRASMTMSSLFNRQIAEVWNPIIERSINILWRLGTFGVLENSDEERDVLAKGKEPEYFPEEIVRRLQDGEEIYQIVYKTQAANAARANEYIGILDVIGVAAQMMQIDPSVSNRLNLHKGIKEIAKIRGTPAGLVRQDDEVEEIEAAQAQAQNQQQMIQAAPQIAGAVKDVAQAEAMAAE
jgi:hypothetical protein